MSSTSSKASSLNYFVRKPSDEEKLQNCKNANDNDDDVVDVDNNNDGETAVSVIPSHNNNHLPPMKMGGAKQLKEEPLNGRDELFSKSLFIFFKRRPNHVSKSKDIKLV